MKLLKLLIKLEGYVQLKIVEMKKALREKLVKRKSAAEQCYKDTLKRIEEETKELNKL